MKTDLNGLEWTHPEPGIWVATLKAIDGAEYRATCRYYFDNETWGVMVTFDAAMVHCSEHESREEAADEAFAAIGRAVRIRERARP